MGQQQLLLIVLGVIIVGVAVVVGIQMFTDSAETAEDDDGEPDDHAEKKPGVHEADGEIVAKHPEMGETVRRIGDGHGQKSHTDAAPVQADQNFYVELHPPAQAPGGEQTVTGRQGIDSETAHGVRDVA